MFDPITISLLGKQNKLDANVASQLAEILQYPIRKSISISGTGADQEDYILKLNIHRGRQVGDIVGTDIFLNDGCKTDFSDLRFYNSAGIAIPHHLQVRGNYEIIPDNYKLGWSNFVHNGAIYASRIPNRGNGKGVYKSTDNGQTYTLLYENVDDTWDIIFVDSKENLFASAGYKIRRSADKGVTWDVVLDMASSEGYARFQSMAEDALGNLYFGCYGEPSMTNPIIYKSTDNGATWEISWQEPTTTSQHVHCVRVDPYTDYIYAGIDAGIESDMYVLRSTDHGATWTKIYSGYMGGICDVAFTPTKRFMGGGATGGSTIFSTEDDITFTPILQTGASLQGLGILGDKVYSCVVVYSENTYSQIYRMNLDGSNIETVWCGPVDRNNGFTGYYNMTPANLPNAATERQLLVGAFNVNGQIEYKHLRIYEGGNHYQATVYIKIPNLPAAGMDLTVVCGNPSAATVSTKEIYDDVVLPTPLLLLKLNEGTGTVIADSSGNGRNGVLTHLTGKGGWNAFGGRYYGPTYPRIIKDDGASYNFNIGDVITIPTDATFEALNKNFSVVAWIRSSYSPHPFQIIGKCSGVNGWGLQGRTAGRLVGLSYGNGTTAYSATGRRGVTGQWLMVGFMLDNSTPARVRFIVNNHITAYKTLTADIAINTGIDLTIGTDAAGAAAYSGDISEIHIYPYELTNKQVQMLYEGRASISDVEPAVTTTLV